jgi:hypothetical protein
MQKFDFTCFDHYWPSSGGIANATNVSRSRLGPTQSPKRLVALDTSQKLGIRILQSRLPTDEIMNEWGLNLLSHVLVTIDSIWIGD